MKKILLLVIAIFILAHPPWAQSVALRDSLSKKLKTMPNDTNRVKALNGLAFQYQLSKPDSTYLLAQQAYELAQSLNYRPGEARALNVMGIAYTNLGDYAKGLKLYNLSKEVFIKIKQPRGVATQLSNIADLYMQQGEWLKGLEKMRESYAILQTMPETDRSAQPIFLSNIGECFFNLKQLDSASFYLKQALPLGKLNNQSILPTIFFLLGDVALAKNNTTEAYANYQQSVVFAIKEASYNDLYQVYYRMAIFFEKNNQSDSTLYYSKQALTFSQKCAYLPGILKSSQNLASLYEVDNDAEALRYYKISVAAKDSLFSQDKVKQLLSVTFEEKQQAQKIEADRATYKNSMKLYVLMGILAAFGVLAFFLIRNNRHKRKAHLLLQKQKDEIDSKAKELLVQKESLQQSYSNVELLGDIGRKITASLSVETIIGTVNDNVNSLMDAAVFGIGIYHNDTRTIEFPATYEKGRALPVYSNAIDDENRLAAKCFNSGKEIVIGDLHTEYSRYLQKMPVPSHGDQPVSLIYLPLQVNEKMLGVITVQSFNKDAFSDYHLFMLRTIAIYAAIALENAESYNKLNHTIDSLQQTQKQLIQAEKMASLGELTAGIAHEIQNPLNFVNNFSEINTELIEEMKVELKAGNMEDAIALANDIAYNEQKINHHGKRADAIVKGMLQHSRNSSSQAKEPTDINKLADEYLRLAYHGLRAKDKSFNATMKTDFDERIGNINIIPQDIGRVILNLITNAFYAAPLPPENGFLDPNYVHSPTVWVSTKKVGDKVFISVKDNGPGIPPKILDKIFQPFFTTKPTGQGTGLGLSLSYDIVKAHGGEIKVTTKENEGTEFIIQLPFV